MDPSENVRQRLALAQQILDRPGAEDHAADLALARLIMAHPGEPTLEMRRLARRLVDAEDASSELAELVLAYVRWRTVHGFPGIVPAPMLADPQPSTVRISAAS